MSAVGTASEARAAFDRLAEALRPKLHRYCARMTGSVIDGEDVVQEALAKAFEALPAAGPLARPEAWLFRIAHNAALDFLRRRVRQKKLRAEEDPDMTADPISDTERQLAAAASLRTFMRLPPAQRSSVILMDVLGHSLDEIGAITETSIPSVKAALHRGRARLRELAAEPEDRPVPALSDAQRALLAAYIDRFNARDFDAVRDMLAEEVRLELVAKTRLNGRREVSRYFQNYGSVDDWHFVPGFVDGRPAVIVTPPADPSRRPTYFVLLEWAGDRVIRIRDFRHARYAIDGAEIVTRA